MALPLTHRINHIPVYVPEADPAWDHDRVLKELRWIDGSEEPPEGVVCPWQEKEDHPVIRYQTGASRYDLSTVSEYLDMSKKPTKFVLKRLSMKQFEESNALQERCPPGLYGQAEPRRYRVKHGLASVEGMEEVWNEKPTVLGYSDLQIESLRELIGDYEYMYLGHAIYLAAHPLSPLEKKV